MASRIEQLIEELADYVDSCKYQPLSNTKIIVVKEEIDALIDDLRRKTPEELSKYQKVVSNQQEILNDARKKAEALINEATSKTTEMVNQNSIMRQAYAQADEVVKDAYRQAKEMLDNATAESNALRSAAVEYMDGLLADYENLVGQTLRLTQGHYESFYSQLSQYMDTVIANRMELNPPQIDTSEIPYFEDETGSMIGVDSATGPIGSTGNLGNTGNLSNTGNIGNTGGIKIPNGSSSDTSDIKLDLL